MAHPRTHRRLPAALLAALAALALAAPAAAWERTAPPDSEEPPWGSDRFQRLALRAGVSFDTPFTGVSGGSAAPYAPYYAAGWDGGVGGFCDLKAFFCPEHAVVLSAERLGFPAVGEETVGGDVFTFGDITGTALALGWGVHFPLTLETELWTCTKAPTVTGLVLYVQAGLGAWLADALTLTVSSDPAGDSPPWWERGVFLYGRLAAGLEFRPFRYVGVFVEAGAFAVLPRGGDGRPGADEAGLLGAFSVRGGLSLMLI